MNILGINFGHDSSACLTVNSKIVIAIEEEKMSRIKQDHGWPEHAIQKIFKSTGLKPSDIDVVAFGGTSYENNGANEIKFRFSKDPAFKKLEVRDRILTYYGVKKSTISSQNQTLFEEEIKKKGFSKASVVFYNHHLCHAYSAFYAAPFISDLIITADGFGDMEAFNYYGFNEKDGIYPIQINDYSKSIGQFYSSITKLLGFRPMRHEGKITGLAAYGKDTELVEKFRGLFRYDHEGNLQRFPFIETSELKIDKKDLAKLSLRERINFSTSENKIGREYAYLGLKMYNWIVDVTNGHTKEDIAYACQLITEEVVLKHTQIILDKYFKGKKVKVTLAGGLFANVRVNQEIFEMDDVENVFIQPAMGDSGLALGAAVMHDVKSNNKTLTDSYKFQTTFLGPEYSEDLESFIKTVGPEYDVRKMEQPAREIAKLINDNVIIGFWHGSMEWGPRALGHRSMILNTFDRKVNDTLNQRLNRTEFMPFAPSVIDYMVKTYMPAFDDNCPAADYMTITYDVDPKYHDLLQAVVHVDGTARPQIVRKEANPYYYDIIDEFYKLSGCGAIVNTSFNVHEEPIVSTPETAFKALKDDRIDVLILEDYYLKKKS
ncbi:MAG: hypothetical protein H6605_07440 [Flavobacteriales bacterium]|nr:hypothetical protein [Flavobacteriales bacterium]